MMQKMGVGYFCFHDVDIAPPGKNLQEFFQNIDVITDLIKEKMEQTGIKLLWNTVNLFSHQRYTHGAASSNYADVFAVSAATIKKGLEICKKLNGQNYVFWGGREGYEWLPNTDMKFEQANIARILKMAVDYAKEIGLDAQMLIEPKPKEPTTHQYDYDAATTMAFLMKHNLDKYFKLNLEANHATLAGHTFDHELAVAACFGALGSIDANNGETILGWDTDEFPTNALDNTLAMYQVLAAGGLGKGGINFDAKIRRTSFAIEDLILAHIAGMDSYARGLIGAAKIIEEKFLEKIVEKRYQSYSTGIGKAIVEDKENLKTLSDYAMKLKDVEIESNHVEIYKSILNDYVQ
nr:xylose isomerase [Spiroplasma clarkii]